VKWNLAHALSVAFKTCSPTVFRPIDQLFANFLSASKKDLFLCIPFALALLSRIDQETVLMQLTDINPNAMNLIGQ
jgi:hypothetical protein